MELNEGIKEVVIEGEKINLKKGVFGWSVVNPIKNSNGTINWKNLISGGSWAKLIFVIIFVVLALGAIFEVRGILEIANQCLNQSTITLIK